MNQERRQYQSELLVKFYLQAQESWVIDELDVFAIQSEVLDMKNK